MKLYFEGCGQEKVIAGEDENDCIEKFTTFVLTQKKVCLTPIISFNEKGFHKDLMAVDDEALEDSQIMLTTAALKIGGHNHAAEVLQAQIDQRTNKLKN